MEFNRFTKPTKEEYQIAKQKHKKFLKNPTPENKKDFEECLEKFTKKLELLK